MNGNDEKEGESHAELLGFMTAAGYDCNCGCGTGQNLNHSNSNSNSNSNNVKSSVAGAIAASAATAPATGTTTTTAAAAATTAAAVATVAARLVLDSSSMDTKLAAKCLPMTASTVEKEEEDYAETTETQEETQEREQRSLQEVDRTTAIMAAATPAYSPVTADEEESHAELLGFMTAAGYDCNCGCGTGQNLNHNNAAAGSAATVAAATGTTTTEEEPAATEAATGLVLDPQLVDQKLAAEFLSLTVKDRNAITEEIHGVSTCAVQEDDDNDDAEENTLTTMPTQQSHSPMTATGTSSPTQRPGRCSAYGTKNCINSNTCIQDRGLEQLQTQIVAIRTEIVTNQNTYRHKHQSKEGYTYNEHIWLYIDLDCTTAGLFPRAGPEAVGTTPTPPITQAQTYPYIHHRTFRLKHLRADLYNARKAAHRYLRCLECLLQFFGPYALQRPLRYDDLARTTQYHHKKGYLQLLPSRDRSGRLVFVGSSSTGTPQMPTTEEFYHAVLQMGFYTAMIASEDVQTQKQGMVFIFSMDEAAVRSILTHHHPSGTALYKLYREGQPVRRSCTHFCLPENNFRMRILRSIMTLAMSKEDRVRTRIHMDGLTTETIQKLNTFGIPVSELPVTSTGQLKTKQHMIWIKSRKAIDEARSKCLDSCLTIHNKKLRSHRQGRVTETNHNNRRRIILGNTIDRYPTTMHTPMYPPYDMFLQHLGNEPITYPNVNDVLFSKGGKNVFHYGNIEFIDLMRRWLVQYSSIGSTTGHGTTQAITDTTSTGDNTSVNTDSQYKNKEQRRRIRQKIINTIHERGGRFLSLEKSVGYAVLPVFWSVIHNTNDLHDRIGTSLYDHQRRLSKKASRITHNHRTNTTTHIQATDENGTSTTTNNRSISPSSSSLPKRRRVNDHNSRNGVIESNGSGTPAA